jgi:branched-chain amino acid aminotransferase
MTPTSTLWQNGKLIPWANATTHVLTHALHYGTAVFEGIRAYSTPDGPAIFKLEEHAKRLFDSAKILMMKIPFTQKEIEEGIIKTVKENKLNQCYIRPIAYYGYGAMGLYPGKNPIDVVIAAWEWGTYLGEEGLEKGIKCKISSWVRIDSRTVPPLAKSSANYLNSALAKSEALNCGYDEAILLNMNGTIAEGPGENIFMVKNGIMYTPDVSDHALSGITAQSAIQLAKDKGITVQRKRLIRDELFLAEELFFTGTAAEITPIREIDGRIIGQGKRGPLTEKIQESFFNAVTGKLSSYKHWLTIIK